MTHYSPNLYSHSFTHSLTHSLHSLAFHFLQSAKGSGSVDPLQVGSVVTLQTRDGETFTIAKSKATLDEESVEALKEVWKANKFREMLARVIEIQADNVVTVMPS